MKTYTINNTDLEFNEIYYVDSVNGLDTNDGLSPQSAFKTIEKYLTIAIDNTACILANGIHVISSLLTAFTKNPNYEQTIIGTGLGTQVQLSNNTMGSMARAKPINFYRFELSLSETATGEARTYLYNNANVNLNMHWYNVAFKRNAKGNPTTTAFYFTSSGQNTADRSTANNCIITFDAIFKDSASSASTGSKQTNNISPFIGINHTTGLAVTASIPNDYWLSNSSYIWKYRGSGVNPDGTIANIGVYGGLFAWDNWDKAKTIDIKLNPLQTSKMAERILVEAIYTNANPTIYACNNANDVIPTWEVVQNNVTHAFLNNTKTATTWAISVRFFSPKSEIPNQQVSSIGIGYD